MEWITCQNVHSETWRRLLEFTNIDIATEFIEKRHGSSAGNSNLKSNYKKQAKQIRVSLLQAKEYFEAANTSSIITSPNHLYYGMVSLASTIMLALGTGDKALDVLREKNENKHHGLEFSLGIGEKQASNGISLFENSYVKVLSNGHFRNWYETLPREGIAPSLITEYHESGTHHTVFQEFGTFKIDSFEEIISYKKASLIYLIKYFPDLMRDFRRYGINTSSARSEHKVMLRPDGTVSHEWLIHGAASRNELDHILQEFKCESLGDDFFKKQIDVTSARVTTTGDRNIMFSYPSMRLSMDVSSIMYADMPDQHEIVDAYKVGFALSMLSRYFPDVWISTLESHCKASQLIELIVNNLSRKFPMMALSILNGQEVVISNHRPFWH